MLISLNWLKEYVDIKVDVPTLAERLTLAGSEVDRIAEQEVDFDGVVVAEVKGLRPLPGSTKNQIAAVTTGGAAVEVVTGAWNIAVGDRVPYATPGSRRRRSLFFRQPACSALRSSSDWVRMQREFWSSTPVPRRGRISTSSTHGTRSSSSRSSRTARISSVTWASRERLPPSSTCRCESRRFRRAGPAMPPTWFASTHPTVAAGLSGGWSPVSPLRPRLRDRKS